MGVPRGGGAPPTARRSGRDRGGGSSSGGPLIGSPGRLPAEAERVGSDPLLVEALRAAAAGRPDPLDALPAHETAPLRRVGALLAIAGDAARAGESAEEVLWRVWQACGLDRRWSDASARGGPVGAAADRDLDAVLALFDAAARFADRLPGADIATFTEYLAEQQLPGDSLADRTPRRDAVELLTAHAARGREWDVVAVPGVQEGAWPDLRLRGSLLGNERLVDLLAGVAEPTGATVSRVAPLLAEERRLFYVACTRARHTLLVSAVQGEDEQPSRFLDELDPLPGGPGRPAGAPAGPRAGAGRAGRRAAPRRLRSRRAGPDRERRPGAPAPRPSWPGWPRRASPAPTRTTGTAPPRCRPTRRCARPTRSSRCPPPTSRRSCVARCAGCWSGTAGATRVRSPRSPASLVHALVQAEAAGAATGELDAAPALGLGPARRGRPVVLPPRAHPGARHARRVRRLGAGQPGRGAAAGRGRAAGAARPGRRGRRPPRGPGLRLRGRVDRLEVDAEGRPVVVDVKTGRTAVSARAAAEHPQLALYQLAAALGAFGTLVERGAPPGGARLVYVADQRADGQAKEPVQPPLDAEGVAHWQQVLHTCAADTSGAVFVARVGPDCDRCPVRTACPAHGAGRGVPDA